MHLALPAWSKNICLKCISQVSQFFLKQKYMRNENIFVFCLSTDRMRMCEKKQWNEFLVVSLKSFQCCIYFMHKFGSLLKKCIRYMSSTFSLLCGRLMQAGCMLQTSLSLLSCELITSNYLLSLLTCRFLTPKNWNAERFFLSPPANSRSNMLSSTNTVDTLLQYNKQNKCLNR